MKILKLTCLLILILTPLAHADSWIAVGKLREVRVDAINPTKIWFRGMANPNGNNCTSTQDYIIDGVDLDPTFMKNAYAQLMSAVLLNKTVCIWETGCYENKAYPGRLPTNDYMVARQIRIVADDDCFQGPYGQ